MYQFIVATRSSGTCVGAENSRWTSAGATVEDISAMSFAAGNTTNKWASRAVVALQLAAWSAVGIVLLEKGVTSLQKSPRIPLNVSQEITTPVSPSDSLHSQTLDNPTRVERLSPNEVDSLSVIPLDGDESNTASNGLEGDEGTKSSWREAEIGTETKKSERTAASAETSSEIPSPRGESAGSGADKSAISPRQQLDQADDKGTNDVSNRSGQLSRLNSSEGKTSGNKATTGNKDEASKDKDQEPKDSERKVEEDQEKEAADGEGQEKNWLHPVTIKVIIDNLEEHRWESRKRLRVARVNAGGGAAAAVAMVAVGAVMLILGPAVIILRALDERRQERRFLKLSGEEDLPPSYEEATSEFDQAPTYSSLNLDSIVATPASPNSNSSENSCLTPNCRRGSCC